MPREKEAEDADEEEKRKQEKRSAGGWKLKTLWLCPLLLLW